MPRAARSDPLRQDGEPVVTAERTLWYVQKLFDYTNVLMERTQARCNYLMFSNSVALVALFTITNALISNRETTDFLVSKTAALVLTLLPAAVFLASLVVAVTAFLPRIYEDGIELNHEFIATMSPQEYHQLLALKSDDSKLNDFVDEIHVLSRILNDRTRRVNLSARLFMHGIVVMPVVFACMIIR